MVVNRERINESNRLRPRAKRNSSQRVLPLLSFWNTGFTRKWRNTWRWWDARSYSLVWPRRTASARFAIKLNRYARKPIDFPRSPASMLTIARLLQSWWSRGIAIIVYYTDNYCSMASNGIWFDCSLPESTTFNVVAYIILFWSNTFSTSSRPATTIP